MASSASSSLPGDPGRVPEESGSLAAFKREISQLIGVNLAEYQDRQMERRIQTLMRQEGASDPISYLEVLRSDPRKLHEFTLGVTIHVSEWFRDAERFEDLARVVMPELLERFQRLRIWSAGCSVGCELYSAVIVADRLGALDRCEFLGTDIDEDVLGRARAGIFGANEQKGLAALDARRYFEPVDAGALQLQPELAGRARFERHDLLADPYDQGFQLILCRNVTIYFTPDSKARVYRHLSSALAPAGVLFLGNVERVMPPDASLQPFRPSFYRKRA